MDFSSNSKLIPPYNEIVETIIQANVKDLKISRICNLHSDLSFANFKIIAEPIGVKTHEVFADINEILLQHEIRIRCGRIKIEDWLKCLKK